MQARHRSTTSLHPPIPEVLGPPYSYRLACAPASAVARGSVPDSAMNPEYEYALPTEVARLMSDRTLIQEAADVSKPLPIQHHVKMTLDIVNSDESSSSNSHSCTSETENEVLAVAATQPSQTSDGFPHGGPLSPHSSAMRVLSPVPNANTAAHGRHLLSLPLHVAAAVASPAAPAVCGEVQLEVDPPVPSMLPLPPQAPIQEANGSLAQDVRLLRVLHSDPSTGWSDWTAMDAANAAVAPPQAANATAGTCNQSIDCHSASKLVGRPNPAFERLQRQLDGFRREAGGRSLFLGRFVMLERAQRRRGGAPFIAQ